MEVKEVYDHALYGVDHSQSVEMVVRHCQTAFDVVKVKAADILLLRVETDDRIVEQGQMPLHPIVAFRGADFYETLAYINGCTLEVWALYNVLYQTAALVQDHAFSCLESMASAVECECTFSAVAVRMEEIVRKALVTDVVEVFYYNYIIRFQASNLRKNIILLSRYDFLLIL